MRILLTNDDGIDSPGIRALADALSSQHEVFVVAPDVNRSGTSHAITTSGSIALERRREGPPPFFACTGTPADCVFLGVTELAVRPELVVSGINFGSNLADDVNYSGTVAAAIEASLLGIPAIAVSLAADHRRPVSEAHWGTAAGLLVQCLRAASEHLLDTRVYWNLNVPNVAIEEVRGVAAARLGRKRICGRMVGADERGRTSYFRAWESPFATDRDRSGSDIAAVDAGYASLTPLRLDRTADEELAALTGAEGLFSHVGLPAANGG